MCECVFKFWSNRTGKVQRWAGMIFSTFGTGIAQPIPTFWERQWEWEIAFPRFGNMNGNGYYLLRTGSRRWYSREWLRMGILGIFPLNLKIRGAKFNPTFWSNLNISRYVRGPKNLQARNKVWISLKFITKKINAQISQSAKCHNHSNNWPEVCEISNTNLIL